MSSTTATRPREDDKPDSQEGEQQEAKRLKVEEAAAEATKEIILRDFQNPEAHPIVGNETEDMKLEEAAAAAAAAAVAAELPKEAVVEPVKISAPPPEVPPDDASKTAAAIASATGPLDGGREDFRPRGH